MCIVRRCFVTALSFLLSLLVITTCVARAQTTALVLQSDAGDYVGRGIQQTFTTSDASFGTVFTGSTGSVHILIFPLGSTTSWHTGFAVPEGRSLAPGVYEQAYDTNNGSPDIEIGRSDRGCGRAAGRFEILEIAFNPNGTLVRFAADFEQHCLDADAALVGAIRFNSTISALAPFGGAPRELSMAVSEPVHGEVTASGITCGGSNVDCGESYGAPASVALTATPDAGYQFFGWTGDCAGGVSPVTVRVNRRLNCAAWFGAIPGTGRTDASLVGQAVVYLDGQPGAYPFGGQRAIFRSGMGALITVRAARSDYIEIEMREARGGTGSTFSFKAQQGASLAPGNYEFATRYPFQSPLSPGLNVSIRGGGCNELLGRFVIHELLFAGDTLQSFAADFEQYCDDGGTAAVFGALRFNTTHASLIPFDGDYPVYQLHVASERDGTVVATGINCGADCEETYENPTLVTVTAVPDPGFAFAGWADDCTGGATTTITVNRRRRCTAVFSPLPGTVAAALDTNTLLIDSQVGDYVGHGQRAVLTGRSSAFTVQFATTNSVRIRVTSPDSHNWWIDLAAPSGEQLTAGRAFEFATGYPFQAPFGPGLAVSYDVACSELRGRFVVYEIAFDPDGALTALAVDFEQHCEGIGPALFGSLRFNPTRASLLPFDGAYPVYQLSVATERGGTITAAGIDCGIDCDEAYAIPTVITLTAVPDSGFVFAGWAEDCTGAATTTVTVDQRRRCTAVFSPLPGTVVAALDTDTLLVDSDSGDYVGHGTRWILTGRSSLLRVLQATPGLVRIGLTDPDGDVWELDLAAPSGRQLMPGPRYEGATRYPFQSATEPGLSFYGDGQGCNTLTGRFVIHDISFGAGGTLTSLAVDFEQHCEGGISGLRGSLRYHSSHADLIPYAGEGKSKLLFRHGITGDLVMWVMGGWTRVASPALYSSRVGTNWRLAGTGDFDGDGKTDWLWQEDTAGDLVVWLMNDTHRSTYRYLSIPRPADPLWKVASVADMNGDGTPDLVWQHAASGALAAWMLDGTTVVDRVSLDPWVIADPNWKVVSTGDFNGDGKADLLWKHLTSGYLIVWMMNDVTRTSVEWLSPYQLVDCGWQIAATADLNGDGKVDIVFQHSDGRLVAWLMDGTNRTSFQMLSPAYVKDPNWRIIGPR